MKEQYIRRRQALADSLENGSILCVFSGRAPMRSLDAAYPFCVDRNFFYLTGIDRENMILLLWKDFSGSLSETLYIEPYDELLAKWVGGRMRAPEATAVSGIGRICRLEDFRGQLNGIIGRSRGLGQLKLLLDLWRHTPDQEDTPAHALAALARQRYPGVAVGDLFGLMARLRAVKDPRELEQLRHAQEDTRVAIEAMLAQARPGINERELEGAFDFALMKRGVRAHAFPSIVAGGPRATTLHYEENDQTVADGQLVLIDLGSAWGHYCADISRTFPVNGKFTPRQKELYDTVLEAQGLVIAAAAPGKTLAELNQLVIDFYESRLEQLGLAREGKTVRDYYYHSVSHHLGLDTHDICTQRERTLAPGMVITVEPGLYVEDEGIGIRIENDILITEAGCEDLSQAIPRTTEEIEALMARR